MAEVRMITLEERHQIEALLKTGISISEVARRISRSKNGVVSEVRLNGGIANYKAVEAQQSAYNRQILGREKLSLLNKGIASSYTTLKQRIENLEMQVEILVDALIARG